MPPRKNRTENKDAPTPEPKNAAVVVTEPPVEEPQPKRAPVGEANDVEAAHPYWLRRGDAVSLDLRKRRFVAVGNLRLTPKSPSGVIPKDMDDQGLRILMLLHEAGHIVAGEDPIPLYPRGKDTVKKFARLLGLQPSQMKATLAKAVQVHRDTLVEGFHVFDLVRELLDRELAASAGAAHIQILRSALNHMRDNTFRRGPVKCVSAESILEMPKYVLNRV